MTMRRWMLLAAAGLVCAAGGCVSVKAPERIDLGGGPRHEPVDSARVPDPQTLEEARAELRKAYAHIQWLEEEVDDAKRDEAKYKHERDRYKDERDRYKDRLEKYEDN